MRGVFTLVLLVGIAPAAHGADTDEPVRAEEIPTARIVDAQPGAAPDVQPVLEIRESARETTRDLQQQESVVAQPPRNWIWTVAAIVVAGLILAAIL